MRLIWRIIPFAVVVLALEVPGYGGTPRFCVIGLSFSGTDSGANADEAAAQSASAGVFNARNQLHQLVTGISRQFESSPVVQAANLATAQAFSAYEVAKAQTLYRVRLSPEGMAADVEIDRLEQQLDDARLQAKLRGADHSDRIDALATALLKDRGSRSRRETSALAEDRAVENLRYAWLDADSKLTGIKEDYAQQLRVDPQWRVSKAQLEQARTALASISN